MRRRFRKAQRPYDPTCPSWCEIEHDIAFDIGEGLRHHERTISDEVSVVAVDNLDEGTRGQAEILVGECSGTDGRWARRLALAVLEATDYLGDGAR